MACECFYSDSFVYCVWTRDPEMVIGFHEKVTFMTTVVVLPRKMNILCVVGVDGELCATENNNTRMTDGEFEIASGTAFSFERRNPKTTTMAIW